MPLTVSAKGSASPEEVWARYTQPELWPTWAPHMKRAVYPYPSIVEGTFGRVYAYGGLSLPFSIDALDAEGRTWGWSVYVAGRRIELEHGVVAGASHARAWVRIGLPLPIALGYAPVAKLALRRLVRSSAGLNGGD